MNIDKLIQELLDPGYKTVREDFIFYDDAIQRSNDPVKYHLRLFKLLSGPSAQHHKFEVAFKVCDEKEKAVYLVYFGNNPIKARLKYRKLRNDLLKDDVYIDTIGKVDDNVKETMYKDGKIKRIKFNKNTGVPTDDSESGSNIVKFR